MVLKNKIGVKKKPTKISPERRIYTGFIKNGEMEMVFKEKKVSGFKIISDSRKYGENCILYSAGKDFYGKVRAETTDKNVEITGASFKFTKKSDLQRFIERLQKAKQFFN